MELAAGMLAPDVIGRMGVSPEVAAAVPSRLTYQFLLEAARREALDLAVMSGRPYRDVVVQIAAHGPARKSQEIAAIALSGMGDIARRLPTGADRDHCVRRIAAVLDEGWSRVEAGAGVNDGQEELLLDIGQRRCAGLDQLWQELDRQVPRPSAVAIFQTPPLILGDGNERAAHPIHARIAGTLVGHVALLSAHPEDQMAVELKMMAPERRVAWLTDVLVRSRLECYMKDVPRVFLNHHRSQINDTIEQALRQAVDLPYRLDGGSAPAVVRVEEDLRNGLDAAAGALHGYWSLRSRRGAGMLRRQPSRHADSQGEALAR
ncbi:MAG TPA: hypothetical protein VIA06_15085 [Candidatus Dormibacteraeota bacterium]|nr:hypothetical protein [Candidatus Dormibacteraeota bacterium]